jgi:hypothetical protein
MRRSSKAIVVAALVILAIALVLPFTLDGRNALHGVRTEGLAQLMVVERGDVAFNREIALTGDLQGLLRRWIEDDAGWVRSFVSYAPSTIVYIDDCSLNLTGSRVVCNCGGRQVSRSMTPIDHELKQFLLQITQIPAGD